MGFFACQDPFGHRLVVISPFSANTAIPKHTWHVLFIYICFFLFFFIIVYFLFSLYHFIKGAATMHILSTYYFNIFLLHNITFSVLLLLFFFLFCLVLCDLLLLFMSFFYWRDGNKRY